MMTNNEQNKKTISEQILVLIALFTGILFDRLMFSVKNIDKLSFASSIFWICYTIIFYAFNWKKLRKNILLWSIAGMACMLSVWDFVFQPQYFEYDHNNNISALNFFVIPCVLMTHAQLTFLDVKLKQVGIIVQEWFIGWTIKPFSAVPKFFSAISPILSAKNKTTLKILTGVLFSVLVLFIVLPLLGRADMVFNYYLESIFTEFIDFSVLGHAVVIVIAMLLFYSFFWNIRFGKKNKFEISPSDSAETTFQIDRTIAATVLFITISMYFMFCIIQFIYLFGNAGLPKGMTYVEYAEYAREGFWQLIVTASINLVMFGIFLHYSIRCKLNDILLNLLLFLTFLILISSFMRLIFYIGTFGMTWLRLISAWFIIYLAIVIILCCVRMFKVKIPVIGVCVVLLLCWYLVLGYANPDRIIKTYNTENSIQSTIIWKTM